MQGLIEQTNPGLKPQIRAYGCFFMDCLACGQIESGKLLSIDQINDAWVECVNKDYLLQDKDGFYQVAKPDAIIGLGYRLVGIPSVACNVMVVNSDGNNWIPNWYSGFKYMFQTNLSENGVHYRLFNDKEVLIYDSYPGLVLGSWQQKSYYIVYRSTKI